MITNFLVHETCLEASLRKSLHVSGRRWYSAHGAQLAGDMKNCAQQNVKDPRWQCLRLFRKRASSISLAPRQDSTLLLRGGVVLQSRSCIENPSSIPPLGSVMPGVCDDQESERMESFAHERNQVHDINGSHVAHPRYFSQTSEYWTPRRKYLVWQMRLHRLLDCKGSLSECSQHSMHKDTFSVITFRGIYHTTSSLGVASAGSHKTHSPVEQALAVLKMFHSEPPSARCDDHGNS